MSLITDHNVPLKEQNIHPWIFYFLLGTVEGIIALIIIAGLQADSENQVLMGYSFNRLALMGITLGLVFIFTLNTIFLWWNKNYQTRWLNGIRKTRNIYLFSIFALFGILFGLLPLEILLSLYRGSGDYTYYGYFSRLLPLLSWVFLLGLQSIILMMITRMLQWRQLQGKIPLIKTWLIIWLVLLATWAFIAITGIGITKDPVRWGPPTVPVMEWQIWLAWGIGILFTLLLVWKSNWENNHLWRIPILDVSIAVVIWIGAVLLWMSQPVPPGYFATTGHPPNFEIYPFSDGAYYASFAQNILVGNGFKGTEIPPRPLYILMLALFHAIGGQDYNRVIALQTLVLALLPVGLYFLGKSIHSRSAGISIAVLAILREVTSISATPFTDNISNSKLFFADLPTTLGIVLFTLAVFYWLKAPGSRRLAPLFCGGTMGIIMLLRTQSFFLLPAIFLVSFIVYRPRWKHWIISLLLLLLGMGISIFPWLWRNWQITGQIVFDDPESQTRVMAMRISETGDINPEKTSGETDAEYSNRLLQIIGGIYKNDPLRVAQFISNHLLNSEIGNLLVLPIRDGMQSLGELWMPERAFWQEWNGKVSLNQASLILLNLGLIALGIATAWKKQRFIGLLPLFFNLSYNLSNALARNSGWRYLLPVDWATYLYFMMGLFEVLSGIRILLGARPEQSSQQENSNQKPVFQSNLKAGIIVKGIVISLGFFLVGASLPLAEVIVPDRYPPEPRNKLAGEILANNNINALNLDLSKLNGFINQEKTLLIKGRSIYPRYYAAGEGEPRTGKTGYTPQADARIVFLVVGKANPLVILRQEQAPDYFPNAADVIIAGCAKENYFQAILVSFLDNAGPLYVDSSGIPDSCE